MSRGVEMNRGQLHRLAAERGIGDEFGAQLRRLGIASQYVLSPEGDLECRFTASERAGVYVVSKDQLADADWLPALLKNLCPFLGRFMRETPPAPEDG